jgi:benzodiazapine receptor
MKSILKLIISIAIPLSVGGLGGYFTSSSVKDWYTALQKPFFNPPAWLFGPVWTTLYVVMGISFFIVWKKNVFTLIKKKALTFYFLQLALNLLWSFIFFYKKQPGWAFAEIIILLISIATTTIYFFRISKTAGWLMVPYIAWVCFATILNYSIWMLNK